MYNRCLSSNFVTYLFDGGALSLVMFALARHTAISRPLVAAVSLAPLLMMYPFAWQESSCRLSLAQHADSPLGADIRTVLRSKFPDNDITAPIDARDRGRAERDKQRGTGLPLIWDLTLAGTAASPLQRQSELEPSLEAPGEADMMVASEPPSSRSRPAQQQPPSTASDSVASNPFTDESSNRHSSAAEAAEEERRRRRDERERVRKQHEDERRQKAVQRGSEEGRMVSTPSAAGGNTKRRFVRRNEFGDEVYDD